MFLPWPAGPLSFQIISVPGCPGAAGWPEYLAQTKQALARGYNVLALQSNSPSGCWSSSNSQPGFVDDRVDVSTRGDLCSTC